MATITKVVLDAGDKTRHVCKYDEVALEYTGERRGKCFLLEN
jgi:hypothetical protein